MVLHFTTRALTTKPIFVTTTVLLATRTMAFFSVLFMPRLLATWAIPFLLIFHLRAALRLAWIVFMRGRRHFPAFAFTRQSSRGLFTLRSGIDAGFVLLTPSDGGRGVGLGSFSSRWGRWGAFLGLQGRDAERQQAAKPSEQVDSWFHGLSVGSRSEVPPLNATATAPCVKAWCENRGASFPSNELPLPLPPLSSAHA